MKNIPLSIILMVHNEEDTIGAEIKEYYTEIVKKIKGTEFIIAEDGSKDKTRDIIKKLKDTYHLTLQVTKEKRGYAKSLRIALETAKGDLVLYADAGGKHDPTDFWKLYKKIETNDLVSGYKAKRNDPFYRLVLAWGLNTLVFLYFGFRVKDIDSGFKLMTKSALKKVLKEKWLLTNNISLEIVLSVFYQGGKITEVPIVHRARKFGTSRGLPPRKIPKVIIQLLEVFPQLKSKMKRVRREAI